MYVDFINSQHANKSSSDNRPKTTIPIIKSIRRSIFTSGAVQENLNESHIRTNEYFRSVNPSLFFETTSVTTNRSTIFNAIASQFPSSPPLGVQLRFKDKRVVVEITPRDDAQCHVLSTQGLTIDSKTVFGTPALRKGSGFLAINLYDLPHLPNDQLILAIQQMLQPYGKLLDISLFLSSPHLFFMGQGCVSLDVTESDQNLSTHTLHFPGIDHEIRAFWKGSPSYCRICHEDTHEKDVCPKAKAHHVQACPSCGGYGSFHLDSCSKHKKAKHSQNHAGVTTGSVPPSPGNVTVTTVNTKGSSNPPSSLAVNGDDHGSEADYSSAPPSPTLSPDMDLDEVEQPNGNTLSNGSTTFSSGIDNEVVTPTSTGTTTPENTYTNNISPTSRVVPLSPETSQFSSSVSDSIEPITTTELAQAPDTQSPMSLIQTVNGIAARFLLRSTYSEDDINIRIGTLNCRGLPKTDAPQRSKHFIHFLKSQSFDILTLQETHAADQDLQTRFHTQFQSSSSFWSQHVGIISLNPSLILTLNSFELDGRVMHVTVSHSSFSFSPVNIIVIYAPARYYHREPFYTSLSQLSFLSPAVISCSILLGDFNYQILSHSPLGIPNPWKSYLSSYWVDSVTPPGDCPTPTFLLELRLGQAPWGPGLWCCNPTLANDKLFCSELYDILDSEFATVLISLTTQQKWDHIKTITGRFARKYSRKKGTHNRLHLQSLQKERRRYLSPLHHTTIQQDSYLISLEAEIASTQSDFAHIDALRAGLRWRENGERSAGYIKCTIEVKQSKRSITQLRHPISNALCSTPETMTDAAQQYYQHLYTPEPVDFQAIDHLLHYIPTDLLSSPLTQTLLTAPFTLENLCTAAKRAPRASTPGSDGLPYPILRLLFDHALVGDLAVDVYNDALQAGVFPASWSETRLCLLPKKGDLSLLSNWRPISLINTDAKVFTRLVNSRILPAVQPVISSVQTGFLPGKFIGDNGFAARLIMEYPRHHHLPGVGLLID
ncbi:hypothetical protein INT45_008660 [Circinella minor]|uniref:Endonuclease/exonuclease/phosphatase domain-containing protein n=1 Tax=Circinella minor TaxID=1195481 RepID=A0A8H7VEV7_9FUNG|nr:hypothetical protein INT45_008660 [Circinella minor]